MTAPNPPGAFSYAEFTRRNLGFVSETEQERIRRTAIFVCGVGGMGGACLQSLVRAGASRLAIADPDTFEVSNLNRQVFAFLGTMGQRKVEAARGYLLDINPELNLDIFDGDWIARIDSILATHPIVVNGMDDLPAAILLYRKAREHGATIIDAYPSPLPSVTVVRPTDPRPEERLGYPTVGRDWRDVTPEIQRRCLMREIEYVLVNSSSARHLHLDVAARVLAGHRHRMSFAPMVLSAGSLMCFEAINLALRRPSGTDYRGYFFNPYTGAVERPRSTPMAWLLSWFARRLLRRLVETADDV